MFNNIYSKLLPHSNKVISMIVSIAKKQFICNYADSCGFTNTYTKTNLRSYSNKVGLQTKSMK